MRERRACSTAHPVRTDGVHFRGYRPCTARPGWVELILRVDGRRVAWCLPYGEDDERTPPGVRLTLRWRPAPSTGVIVEETDRSGGAREVSAARALTVLGHADPPELAVDERLVALFA